MRWKHLPNLITGVRLIGTACLLWIEPLSAAFYIIYTVSGFSDVVDGWVARSMGTTSELGAKLDSVADLLFYAMMIFRIFPILWAVLPMYIWITLAATIAVRLISYTVVAVKYRRFAAQHTYLNKLSGLMTFAVPYLIETAAGVPFCTAICVVIVLAALEELAMHLCSKEYCPAHKTIFHLVGKRGEEPQREPIK